MQIECNGSDFLTPNAQTFFVDTVSLQRERDPISELTWAKARLHILHKWLRLRTLLNAYT